MAISLASLRATTAELPPRILIYGPPGIGKTTLAAEFPDVALVRVEDGVPSGVHVMAFPVVTAFLDVIAQLGELYTTPDHGARTVVIDSITELQRHIFTETCARGNEYGKSMTSIDSFGFGKGYTFARAVMGDFLEAINALRRDCGLTIILIAHSVVARYDDPETEAYDQFQIDLHKQLGGMVEREMDAILFLRSPVEVKTEDRGLKGSRSVGKSKRIRKIYTEGAPAYVAKNRYGMPPEIRYDLGEGYAALAPYLPTHTQET